MITSTNNTVSSEAISFDNRVNVFPNPTTDIIQIQLDELKPKILLEIFSIDGKIMAQKSFLNQSRLSMNLSNYNDGIYFVKITTGNETRVKKVIKE